MSALAFIVPGALDQITGGYLFDRRIVEGLRARGLDVAAIELPGRFPDCDAVAEVAAAAALAALPANTAAVIDGLALPALADCLADEARRLRLLAFVHHPLALEAGLTPAEATRLARLEAALLPLFAGVVCPSAATAEAVAAYGVPAERIAVTPPGTLKPAQPPRLRPERRPLAMLSVATITPRKGHLLLVEALASLAPGTWTLTCVGGLDRDPAHAASVRAAIAAHRLEAWITLAGEHPPDRLGAFYEAADLFVLPSYHEGYGMAYAEALAYGLPIVATRAGAIPTTVPEAAGLLVPTGDVAALAAALTRVVADPALRGRLAAGAIAAGACLRDWDGAVEQWMAAAARLLGGLAS